MISEKPVAVAKEKGLKLPRGYRTAIDQNLVNLAPWGFVNDKVFDLLYTGINQRYPLRAIIPFAKRGDNDDAACFIVSDPEQQAGEIIVIHDFAGKGWEVVGRFKTFWDWFKYAIDEMIESIEAEQCQPKT